MMDGTESEARGGSRRKSRKRIRVKVKPGGGWSESWPLAVGWIGAILGGVSILLRWLPGWTLPAFFVAWFGFISSLIALGVRSMRQQALRQPAIGVGSCITAILLELILQKVLPPDLAMPQTPLNTTAATMAGDDESDPSNAGPSAADLLEQAIQKDREDAQRFERSLPNLRDWKTESVNELIIDREDPEEAIRGLTRREIEVEFDSLEIGGMPRRAAVAVRCADAPVSDALFQEICPFLNDLPNLRRIEFPLGGLSEESLPRLESRNTLKSLILPRASDAVLAELVRFPNLESLEFTDRNQLTDVGLESVANLRYLVTLDLGLPSRRSKGLTDAGLARLAPLGSLRTLRIPQAAITGSGLAGELFLVRLKRLDLSYCYVDDARLPLIGKFQALEDLRLRQSQITGTGLGALRECSRLRRLDLSLTNTLKSVNLALLVGLPALEELLLSECPLEEGVGRVLSKLETLKLLDVANTPLPRAIAERLQKDLPECRVIFGDELR